MGISTVHKPMIDEISGKLDTMNGALSPWNSLTDLAVWMETVVAEVENASVWSNSIDEEDDQTSSWESEPEEENAEEPLAWRRMMKKESGSHQMEKEN